MSQNQQVPLHEFHARNGARFVPFSGWDMPVQYSSILEEHTAVRQAAGLFDVSHMGEFKVTGPEAETFLNRLVTNKITDIPAGKAVYSPMCDASGGVVDDLIVYRIACEDFLVCVNASNRSKDLEWFQKSAEQWQFAVSIVDVSDDFALLALQGPKAVEILTALNLTEATTLKRFWHAEATFEQYPIRICRTGYTGEDGFEIYLSPTIAESFAEKLLEAGQAHGLQLCGLGARDSLRLEAGLPLYGHEMSATISPVEAGFAWTVKLKKGEFTGRTALEPQILNGPSRQIIHFRLEGRRIARQGTPILNNDSETVGEVVSGTLSPMSKTPIGSALVHSAAINQPLAVDLRGNQISLQIAKPPLHLD